MLTPSEIEKLPKELETYFSDLERRIMEDIVRRIKINSEITRSADWQINRLSQLGKSKENIKLWVKETLELSESEIDKMYQQVIDSGYAWDKAIYKQTGKKLIQYKDNKELQQMISAYKTQTKGALKNITQSMGFSAPFGGKAIFTPMSEFYQKTLDSAILDITNGTFDYNTVLKRTVQEMTNSGVRTVEFGATNWSNRVEVASRRAVMTGINQVTGHIAEKNAEELGTEHFEVTAHGTARESHQMWQGKVYTKKELVEICGYGTITGLKGANCYHDFHPFIPGISERTYTDKELEEWARRENTPKEYSGKQYTAYEATQHQRKLETLMRKQRQDINLLNKGGADKDEIIAAKSRYRSTMSQYADFSKRMELPQQKERIYMDGLGKINNKGKATSIEKIKDKGFRPIETVEEAKKALIDDIGFIEVEESLIGIDDELLIANTTQLRKLEDKFGMIHESTSTISAGAKIDSMAYVGSTPTNPSAQNLILSSEDYKSKTKMIEYKKRAVENGYFMPMSLSSEELSIATVTHEYGHILQNVLTKREMEKHGWSTSNARSFMNFKGKSSNTIFKWYNDVKTSVIDDCYSEIIEIATTSNKNFVLESNISKYGSTNKEEFFAEVFANSQLGKPNELGKAMNSWLDRRGLIK